MKTASPLRYPGGKWRVAPIFERLIELNGLDGCSYFEPYAGGASLALSLLIRGRVADISLNDLDPAIHAFWSSVLRQTKEFVSLVKHARLTPQEWSRQRRTYDRGSSAGMLALGFATFYLNRTNHSGVLNGGMIGGRMQAGTWKLDARFNKDDLIERIRRVASLKSQIHLSRRDADDFLQDCRSGRRRLVYLDPPYYRPGRRRLYLDFYSPEDHAAIRDRVVGLSGPWIVSYDDDPKVRALYRGVTSRRLQLLHTAREARIGREVLFFSPCLRIPSLR